MTSQAHSSFSRLRIARPPQPAPKPTRGQKAIEVALFVIFGMTIALAAVALYATNSAEHQRVPNRVAAGIASDRVNVLLIGSSTRTRSNGSNEIRIESLMLVSMQPSTGRAALMSIPLDLWVKLGRHGQRPLRTAHAVGDASGYPGAGAGLTVDTIETVIGQPIHAFVRFGIGDVQRLVDSAGGVEVDVRRGVYDYRYKLRFRRGIDQLDGTEAIRYAYSPYVTGPAASRFAREQRQRQVMVALLSKLMKDDANLERLTPMFGPLVATNLTPQNTVTMVASLRRGDQIRAISFAPYVEAFDVTSVAYRGEAVRPRAGDFETLRQVAAAAFVR